MEIHGGYEGEQRVKLRNVMKLSPKLLAKCEPITKTDGKGNKLLVGYRRIRNSRSRKTTQEFFLKEPIKLE